MKYFLLITIALVISSCNQPFFDKEPEPNAVESYNYLWNECNNKYAFFEYKNIDWDSVKTVYDSRIYNGMPETELFSELFNMLNVLRDGHVNLVSDFQISRFPIDQLGADNFDFRVIEENYLTEQYYITGALKHDQLIGENIGYIRYDAFTSPVTEDDMNFTLNRYQNTDGLIIDVRANGGGSVLNIWNILGHFVEEEKFAYDSYLKSGPGKDEFSGPGKAYIKPKDGTKYLNKPVVILTDRGSYSATSFFSVSCMALDNFTQIGDTTGGGLGAPNGGQLPNGWTYRFSVSRTIATDGQNYENGVPPAIQIDLDPTAVQNGEDTILDRAITFIKTGS